MLCKLVLQIYYLHGKKLNLFYVPLKLKTLGYIIIFNFQDLCECNPVLFLILVYLII